MTLKDLINKKKTSKTKDRVTGIQILTSLEKKEMKQKKDLIIQQKMKKR